MIIFRIGLVLAILLSFLLALWRTHRHKSEFAVYRALSPSNIQIKGDIDQAPSPAPKNVSIITMAIAAMAHDSAVAFAVDNKVVLVVEMERIFGISHFGLQHVGHKWVYHVLCRIWKIFYKTVLESLLTIMTRPSFDRSIVWREPVVVLGSWEHARWWLRAGLKSSPQRNASWERVLHHNAHAYSGLFDSPFEHAIIVSVDGGGGDLSGYFNIYYGRKHRTPRIQLIGRFPDNLAFLYQMFAGFITSDDGSAQNHNNQSQPSDAFGDCKRLMDLSCYGVPDMNIVAAMKVLNAANNIPLTSFKMKQNTPADVFSDCFAHARTDPVAAKQFAASAQRFLEDIVLGHLSHELSRRNVSNLKMDGIILTGGVALNGHLARAITRQFSWLPVHVPTNPTDSGSVVGLLYRALPSLEFEGDGIRLGLPIQGLDDPTFTSLAKQYGAVRASPKTAAKAFVKSHQSSSMIVVRGRQAMGGIQVANSRSILISPQNRQATEDISKSTNRGWYDPFPIVVAEGLFAKVFANNGAQYGRSSPYGLRVGKLSLEVQLYIARSYPNVSDGCGYARPQMVRQNDDPWFHQFLIGCWELGSLPFLLYRTATVRTPIKLDPHLPEGRPMLNYVKDAINLWQHDAKLTTLIVEDFLFEKSKG